MSTIRVVDSGPIIGFAKIGRLDLLEAEGKAPIVAETVAREVLAGESDDPARQALLSGWGERMADIAAPSDLAQWKLDPGEQSVLALARHIGAIAVLDDKKGRRAARALSITHTGTAGIVAAAKRRGLIQSAASLLRDLDRAGMYLPAAPFLEALLQTLGEDWP